MLHYRKNISIVITLLALVYFFANCAYFNVFYNAKKSYNKGIEAIERSNTNKPTNEAINNFNLAIEKASKVLDLYPGNRWNDDALLLIGKSYYHMQNYPLATRSFRELIDNFPNSNLMPDARYYYANTLLQQNQFDLAAVEFQKITESNANDRLKSEAYFGLADRFYFEERYEDAIEQYSNLLNEIKNKDVRMQAQLKIAESYRALGDFEYAAEEFKKVRNYDPPDNIKYLSEFGYGISLQNLERYDEAITVFTRLLDDRKYFSNYTELFIEVARCHELEGDIEEAIKVLERLNSVDLTSINSKNKLSSVLNTNPVVITQPQTQKNTKETQKGLLGEGVQRPGQQPKPGEVENPQRMAPQKPTGNPEALFYIGELHLYKYFDLSTATKYYTDALRVNPSNELQVDLNNRIKLVRDLQTLQRTLKNSPPKKPYLEIKPTAKQPEQIETGQKDTKEKTKPITMKPPIAEPDTTHSKSIRKRPENLKAVQESLAKKGDIPDKRRKIRELEKIEERPSKAIQQQKPERPDNSVVFSDSSSYLKAQKEYEVAIQAYNKERSQALYQLSELFFLEFNIPDSANYFLDMLIEELPEHPYAAKSMLLKYNIASSLDEDNAESIKNTMLEKYPDSDYLLYFHAESDSLISTIKSTEKDKEAPPDSSLILYQEAGNLLFNDKEYISAIERYLDIVEQYHDSLAAQKAMYAVGWILENKLGEIELATKAYNRLKSDYPASEPLKLIQQKLNTVETFRANQERMRILDEKRRIALAKKDSTTAVPSDSMLQERSLSEITAKPQILQEPAKLQEVVAVAADSADSAVVDSIVFNWIDFSRIDSLLTIDLSTENTEDVQIVDTKSDPDIQREILEKDEISVKSFPDTALSVSQDSAIIRNLMYSEDSLFVVKSDSMGTILETPVQSDKINTSSLTTSSVSSILSEELIKRILADTVKATVFQAEILTTIDSVLFVTIDSTLFVNTDSSSYAYMDSLIKTSYDSTIVAMLDSVGYAQFDSLITAKLDSIARTWENLNVDTIQDSTFTIQPDSLVVPVPENQEIIPTDSLKTTAPDSLKTEKSLLDKPVKSFTVKDTLKIPQQTLEIDSTRIMKVDSTTSAIIDSAAIAKQDTLKKNK